MDRQANIEYLHDSGKMPDWYYYQVNGRTFQANYKEIRNKRQKEQNGIITEKIETAIEEELEKTIGNYLNCGKAEKFRRNEKKD